MLRILAATTLLFSTVAAPAVAHADPEVREARKEMRDARRHSRQVDRLVDRWERAVQKDKTRKLARLDADVADLVADEMVRLRALGVATKVPDEPERHPYHWIDLPETDPENPRLEALRDQLVELRQLQRLEAAGEVKRRGLHRKAVLLDAVASNVAERYERKERKLEAARAS